MVIYTDTDPVALHEVSIRHQQTVLQTIRVKRARRPSVKSPSLCVNAREKHRKEDACSPLPTPRRQKRKKKIMKSVKIYTIAGSVEAYIKLLHVVVDQRHLIVAHQPFGLVRSQSRGQRKESASVYCFFPLMHVLLS